MVKKSAEKPDLPRDAARATPIYFQLATKLRQELLLGSQTPGSAFDSNRELVARLGVSLLTVRRALDELVKADLLEQRHGAGTFVSQRIQQHRENARAENVRQDAILFSGWGLEALSGWDAMYFRDIYTGLKQAALERGLRVLADHDLESGPDLAERASQLGIRGAAILQGSRVRERAAELSAAGIRTVTLNFRMNTLASIMPDDFQGARQAVRHLLDLGHRRLVHLNSGESAEHWTEVRRGYEEEIVSAGLALETSPVFLSPHHRGSLDAGRELMLEALKLPERPSAVFAGNDLMAIGALRALRERNIRVPEEISVVGFDNIEATEICTPALTTISVDRTGLGQAAVEYLLSTDPPTSEHKLMAVTLKERESTAPAAVTQEA